MPHRVELEGDDERPGDEEQLAGDEGDELEAARAGEALLADAPGDDVTKVVDEVPLDGEQRVEEPRVDVLVAVPGVARLVGREPHEGLNVDVDVEAHEVGVGVVEDVVLPVPDPRAAAEEVEPEGGEAVDRAV